VSYNVLVMLGRPLRCAKIAYRAVKFDGDALFDAGKVAASMPSSRLRHGSSLGINIAMILLGLLRTKYSCHAQRHEPQHVTAYASHRMSRTKPANQLLGSWSTCGGKPEARPSANMQGEALNLGAISLLVAGARGLHRHWFSLPLLLLSLHVLCIFMCLLPSPRQQS